MERYLAQKADQAFEAMCGPESLTDRIKNAKLHFISVSGDHYLSTAPAEVRESITELMEIDLDHELPRAAVVVRNAIASTLEEFARQEAAEALKRVQVKRANGPSSEPIEP